MSTLHKILAITFACFVLVFMSSCMSKCCEVEHKQKVEKAAKEEQHEKEMTDKGLVKVTYRLASDSFSTAETYMRAEDVPMFLKEHAYKPKKND